MKILSLFFGLVIATGTSIAGENKLSKEMVTIKACQDFINVVNQDLGKINDIAIEDTNKKFAVRLKWHEGNVNCKSFHWFKYDGTIARCDECENAPSTPPCSCPLVVCE